MKTPVRILSYLSYPEDRNHTLTLSRTTRGLGVDAVSSKFECI